MRGDPVTDEDLAALFHVEYERLAPSFGYTTREASAVPWDQVPENNRALVTAVAGSIRSTFEAEVRRLGEVVDEYKAVIELHLQEVSQFLHPLGLALVPNAERVAALAEARREARVAALGYWVQPVANELPEP